MRALSTFLAVSVSAAACAAVVSPTLPQAEWVDCEAATNVALPAASWRGRGHFDVRISIAAGTNLVQLAFGRDADGDGGLSLAETALVVGRSPGEASVRTARPRASSPPTRLAPPHSPNGGTRLPRGASTRRGTRSAPSPRARTGPTGGYGWRSAPTGPCSS